MTVIYRSVLFQILAVGVVAFTQPGIWNALNNLGAGGEEKPYLVNAANALTYGIMIFGCALAGGICNKIGCKWTLVLGVIFYTPYASSLYCNNRFGNEWYVMLGAALCGVGASMFWASEAAIAVGYPSEAQRGRMVAIWMGLRNVGPLIGGAISLSLNTGGSQAGKVSYTTYLALIGIQCLGFPVSLLLSPPDKVIRPDGTPIPHLKRRQTTSKAELKGIWAVITSPSIALLIPVFITGTWGTTYQSNYLTTYFSVRTRALASLLTACMNIVADIFLGIVTDAKKIGNQSSRAKLLWFFFAFFTTALWVWQTITQVHFVRNPHAVDWTGSTPRFNNAMAVYLMWKFVYEGQVVFLYWLVGTYPHSDGTLERVMGVLRAFESVGSCFSYIVGATHWPNLNQGILAFAMWLACLVPATLAVCRVPPQKIEVTVQGQEEEEEEKRSSSSETDTPDEKVDLDSKV